MKTNKTLSPLMLSLVMCLLFILSSCNLSSRNGSNGPYTVYSSQVPTASATHSFIPEVKPTSTPPNQSIDLITSTPLPTLTHKTAEAKVVDLVASNGNCQFPCWWGIAPGETSWNSAFEFFTNLGANVRFLRETNEYQIYGVSFEEPPKESPLKTIGASFHVSNGKVRVIRTGMYRQLDVFLNEYGPPNEIWLAIDVNSITQEAPFTLALYYSQKGMLAVYEGTTPKTPVLNICPQKIIESNSLWLFWSPKPGLSFTEAGREVLLFDGQPSDRPFFNLEEITEYDPGEFFETYKLARNVSICFEAILP